MIINFTDLFESCRDTSTYLVDTSKINNKELRESIEGWVKDNPKEDYFPVLEVLKKWVDEAESSELSEMDAVVHEDKTFTENLEVYDVSYPCMVDTSLFWYVEN